MADGTSVPMLIAFTDFQRFTAQVERSDDAEVARVLDGFYELAGELVTAAGGRVVKFIGDAALLAFPEQAADRGVHALLHLKVAADRFLVDQRWECRLVIRAHYGPVVAGLVGTRDDKRYDVLGKAVNVAARLPTSGVALSAEAFRRLSPATRTLFKKHTPPVTYIRVEDAHESRLARRR